MYRKASHVRVSSHSMAGPLAIGCPNIRHKSLIIKRILLLGKGGIMLKGGGGATSSSVTLNMGA